MLRKIIMQVISSIELSSYCHLLIDSFMIASAAFSAELLLKWGIIIAAASSFEINSHTPSLARQIKLSPSTRFISRISGEAITPT